MFGDGGTGVQPTSKRCGSCGCPLEVGCEDTCCTTDGEIAEFDEFDRELEELAAQVYFAAARVAR